MFGWLDIGQILEVIGFCTCAHFAQKALGWITDRCRELCSHIKSKSSPVNPVIWIDGVPLITVSRVEDEAL